MVKVGKLKKGPVNKTDTSFTAKKVVIRAQNIKTSPAGSKNDNDSALLARIKSFLPNCGHYNANMRKDATLNILKSLKEISNLQSTEFLSVLEPIFSATFRQLCDDEINVRSAFLGLLSFLFDNLKAENVAGFFPRWISFLNLACSHIKPEIRRDSIRFIVATLKTRKDLLLPYLHTLIPVLVPLLTQYPQRSGQVPAYDCILGLIDAYLEPFLTHKKSEELAKPLQSYVWQDSSPQPEIYLIRQSPQIGPLAKPQPIPESALIALISHLGNLSISLWLDTVHLLTAPSHRNSTEFRQVTELIALYKKLFNLAKCAGDEEIFWKAMPVKLVKNHKTLLETKLS